MIPIGALPRHAPVPGTQHPGTPVPTEDGVSSDSTDLGMLPRANLRALTASPDQRSRSAGRENPQG